MRMGRVTIDMGYVVDLDNQKMVNNAIDCLYEDAMSAVKYNELVAWIKVHDAPEAKPVDIPEFLLEISNDE